MKIHYSKANVLLFYLALETKIDCSQLKADLYESDFGTVLKKGSVGVSDFTETYCIFSTVVENIRKMIAIEPSLIFDHDQYIHGIVDSMDLWNWRDVQSWKDPSESSFDLKNIGLLC